MPQMTPIASSNLASVGYDGDVQQLYVRFKSGRTYRYEQVPAHVYDDLMNASSAGTYFNEEIKDVYGCTPV